MTQLLVMPERIQRKRTRGWRLPDGALYVGRPTKWGNRFKVADAIEWGFAYDEEHARRLCVECFRDLLVKGRDSEWWCIDADPQLRWMREHLDDLRGHDLACWCPPDQPCHADVLLGLANAPECEMRREGCCTQEGCFWPSTSCAFAAASGETT